MDPTCSDDENSKSMSPIRETGSTSPEVCPANETVTVKIKQPCKKKYQEILDDLWSKIKSHETELNSLQTVSSNDKEEQLKSSKNQRSSIISRRKEIADQIENLYKQSNAKKSNLMKLQQNFQYKSEDHINSAISNLNYQLKTTNFRASVERKIVQEIDTLTRSKKSLNEYNKLKQEFDEIKSQQMNLRREKDSIFSQLRHLKVEEDALKSRELQKQKKMDDCKHKIDEMYRLKRDLMAQHRKEILSFEHMKEQRAKQTNRKRDEERKAAREAKVKELQESRVTIEPYKEEQLLCETLVSYLQRYEITPTSTPSTQSSTPVETPLTPVTPTMKELDTGQIVYVLKRKDDDVDAQHQSYNKRNKKSRSRDKRRTTQNKGLHHTPQVFEQFSRLNLQAPSNLMEVPVSIEQLKAKKKYYGNLIANPEAAADTYALYTLTSDVHDDKIDEMPKDVSETANESTETTIEQKSPSDDIKDSEETTESITVVDDGYSEVNDNSKDGDVDNRSDSTKVELIMTAPSDTICSNSSDADSALAEEIKSLESPEVICSEVNKFAEWRGSRNLVLDLKSCCNDVSREHS